MLATVVCNSCHRTWEVSGGESVYLQLELLSRPCPYCEAYTLSYRDRAAARGVAPFRPIWKRRVIVPRQGSAGAKPGG
jgi:hypothetical protein